MKLQQAKQLDQVGSGNVEDVCLGSGKPKTPFYRTIDSFKKARRSLGDDRDDRNVIFLDEQLCSVVEQHFFLMLFTPYTEKVKMHEDAFFYSRVKKPEYWETKAEYVRCTGKDCPYCTLGIEAEEFCLIPAATRSIDPEIKILLAPGDYEKAKNTQVLKDAVDEVRNNPSIKVPLTINSYEWGEILSMNPRVENHENLPENIELCRDEKNKIVKFNFEDYCYPRYSAKELKSLEYIAEALWRKKFPLSKFPLKK
jgi:hypothetical protein